MKRINYNHYPYKTSNMKKTLLLNYLKAATSRNPRKNKTRFNGLLALFVLVMGMEVSWGQTSYTSTSATGAWNTSRWNNSSNTSPYTSSFTSNNAVNFASGTYTFAGMGATVNVGNVTVASNVTVNFTSTGNTFATGGSVRTFNIGNGGLFDFNGNSISTTTGTGFIKSGEGVFATGGGTFTGGFTINQGTVIARGTTGLGSGTGNLLTLNGGTIASNATRIFDNTRFPGGIVIGGDVQFGEMDTAVSLANNTANLSFANNVSLGNSLRTLTLGNGGTITFSGIISNTAATGINFAANANGTGKFVLTGANTYSGNTTVLGGTLQLNKSGGTTIPTTNTITVSGGTLQISSNQTLASLDITSGTVQIDSGVTLTIAGNVSIPSGVNLILNGVLTSTGTRTLTIASGANVTIGNTSGLETATGTFSGGKTFTTGANYLVSVATTTPLGVDVSANNFSTTESITLNSALSVSGSLSFGNVNSKTITTDGNLTLKSTSLGTACISDLTNGGANSGNTISGNVTVERYIPAKRAWRLLTAPLKDGSTSNTIGANWQGTANEGLLLFSPATYQTQTMTGYTTGGGSPNIWKYNSTSTQWQSIADISTEGLFSSTVNNGFLVFATGPSNSSNIASGSTDTTLKPVGQLITGSVNYALTANKYHLIGNPYASPLDTEAMVQAHANSKAYMVDPTISTVGGYVTFDGSNWSVLPSGSDKYIQSGQGFFLKSTTGGTFTIAETHKVSGNTNTWFQITTTDTSADKIRVMLYKQSNSTWQLADGILAVNSASGNDEVDAVDTDKMSNFNENLWFKNGTSNLAIEYRGLPAAGTLQPLQLTGTSAQGYELRIKTENYSNSNLTPYLENTQTGALTAIPTDGSEVAVPFTGIAATSAAPDTRFRIVYQSALHLEDTNSLAVGVYPNPVNEGLFTVVVPQANTPASYTLINLLGQEVQKGTLLTTNNSIQVQPLTPGVYLLQVDQEGKQFTTKIMIN